MLLLLAANTGMPTFSYAQGYQAQIRGLNRVLDELYAEMLPLCEQLISVGRGIAAFAAIFYIGHRVWRHIAAAEPEVESPKKSKKELYEAAIAAAGKSADDETGATTPRKRAAKKADAPAAEAAEAPKADEAPQADEAQAENPEKVAAVEDAVEAEVVREEEAERSTTSEKGDEPAKGEGS